MGVLEIIGLLIAGLIIGAIARLLVPGRQPMGMLMTMVLGVVGSFLGGLITNMFVQGDQEGLHPAGWIMSIVGAIILVWIYSMATSRRGHV